ncbi:g patch domain-containing protein 1 [Trichonephila clavata]|uniref:G patch domain-containing protein 1 n=1 Tax=Trichonephila clavata TaxID=2740835 RepID=A0A8X6KNL9_TRICU|nr:g patch domain-containing protein 1 [Trichonephila clavata]
MDEDDDEYISHGTPLPEIEEESVLRKKAARELEVRDERGRQRFHGAFTGGFSAGYFNTVGTKEGWAPSTFISSRDKKEKAYKSQNPEDFMDEEDFGAFGIATRRIHTTSKFQDSLNSTNTNKRKFSEVDSVIPGEAPLKDIVKPVKESIGIKILKKLGWKLGQGIGPRAKKPVTVKVYGCALPDTIESEEDDPYAESYTFAPEDTEGEIYKPKDNVFGLGYSGLSKESVLSAHSDTLTTTKSWLKKDKKKLAISGQAFGVGAFEDDDEDIYSKDDMSQYDFSDLDPKGSSQASKETIGNRQHHGSSNSILDGFCLASNPASVKKYYPPPELPPHYKPLHSSKTRVVTNSEPQFKSRHSMSADDRSTLLGERKFQSLPSAAEKKTSVVKPLDENLHKNLPSSKHSFRPFPNDEVKQKRYEEYLKLKDLGDTEKLVQPSSMTEWEKQQELEEFARAAFLFKPLSAVLNAKFESRSHLDVEHEVMDALAKARKENVKKVEEKRKLVGLHNRKTFEWHPTSLLCKRFNVPNPYPNSSEVSGSQKSKSLFDHISFDIRETDRHEQISHTPAKSIPDKIPSSERPNSEASHKPNQENISDNPFMAPINKTESASDLFTETGRPPIDFFKDIFENSSSDEEDATQIEKKSSESPPRTENFEKESNEAATSHETDVLVSNQKCSSDISTSNPKGFAEIKKAGFGVFANLDLDALNQRGPKVKLGTSENAKIKNDVIDISKSPVKENNKTNDASNIQIENQSLQDDLYGPELPPDYNESSVSNSSKCVTKKHSKHKSKHKHKHHKYKSKKKKKKHSSHKSSDDSSFDSDEDIPPKVVLEKIKKLLNGK